MVKNKDLEESLRLELWEAARSLISLDSSQRDQTIERLSQIEGFQDSALMSYLLISRLKEPDLDIRFHLVQLLGSLLDYDNPGVHFPDQILPVVHHELTLLTGNDYQKILEVSSRYLSAEKAVYNILKLCSYAGNVLSGIVNDRKLPVQIRQQAVFFCGELGLLETRTALDNLMRRVQKTRKSTQSVRSRKDDEQLYGYAAAARLKLEI